jgi:tetratricopeptide (TPR) repeat protein
MIYNREDAQKRHSRLIKGGPSFKLFYRLYCKRMRLNIFTGLRRYEEAIICYDEIIKKLDPTYVKAWDGKVYVLVTLGNALFNLAREEDGLRRYEEAIICYDEIIKKKLDPTYDNKRYALLRRWVSIKQQRYKHR